MKVTRENATEFEPHRWIIEASTLGCRPGEWPKQIDTDLGNRQRFLILGMTGDGASYRQMFGCISLKVLND